MKIFIQISKNPQPIKNQKNLMNQNLKNLLINHNVTSNTMKKMMIKNIIHVNLKMILLH